MQLQISSSHQRCFLAGITSVSDCGYKGEDNNIVTMLHDKTL